MKAQSYNFDTWIPDLEHKKLVKYITDLLLSSGFEIIGFTEHEFQPQGYSCVFLLSESHLAIHTFPEDDSINIQLSSCVPDPFYDFIHKFNINTIKFLRT